jgi:hypothetical protein
MFAFAASLRVAGRVAGLDGVIGVAGAAGAAAASACWDSAATSAAVIAGVGCGASANVDLMAVGIFCSGWVDTLVRFELLVALLDCLGFFIFSSTEFANTCVWRNLL